MPRWCAEWLGNGDSITGLPSKIINPPLPLFLRLASSSLASSPISTFNFQLFYHSSSSSPTTDNSSFPHQNVTMRGPHGLDSTSPSFPAARTRPTVDTHTTLHEPGIPSSNPRPGTSSAHPPHRPQLLSHHGSPLILAPPRMARPRHAHTDRILRLRPDQQALDWRHQHHVEYCR